MTQFWSVEFTIVNELNHLWAIWGSVWNKASFPSKQAELVLEFRAQIVNYAKFYPQIAQFIEACKQFLL